MGVLRYQWRVGTPTSTPGRTSIPISTRRPDISIRVATRPSCTAPGRCRDRVTVLFRAFMVIPHYVVLFFVSLAGSVVLFAAWFVVLFTGTWPEGHAAVLYRLDAVDHPGAGLSAPGHRSYPRSASMREDGAEPRSEPAPSMSDERPPAPDDRGRRLGDGHRRHRHPRIRGRRRRFRTPVRDAGLPHRWAGVSPSQLLALGRQNLGRRTLGRRTLGRRTLGRRTLVPDPRRRTLGRRPSGAGPSPSGLLPPGTYPAAGVVRTRRGVRTAVAGAGCLGPVHPTAADPVAGCGRRGRPRRLPVVRDPDRDHHDIRRSKHTLSSEVARPARGDHRHPQPRPDRPECRQAHLSLGRIKVAGGLAPFMPTRLAPPACPTREATPPCPGARCSTTTPPGPPRSSKPLTVATPRRSPKRNEI